MDELKFRIDELSQRDIQDYLERVKREIAYNDAVPIINFFDTYNPLKGWFLEALTCRKEYDDIILEFSKKCNGDFLIYLYDQRWRQHSGIFLLDENDALLAKLEFV